MNQSEIDVKISEALSILVALGLPKEQQNDRSALCLLALLGLMPSDHWRSASAPLIGITPMMDWMKAHYAKKYAPNSRETVRRQTMHQFIQAGISLYNPDDPSRATNSPKAVYQIYPGVLTLLRAFGTKKWTGLLKKQLKSKPSLSIQYAKHRHQKLVPVILPSGTEIKLSPGEHSELIKDIIEEFGARFAQNSLLVYVGDTGEKFGFFDEKLLTSLNVSLDSHGKMPDVVLYLKAKNWLFLIEAVTSHGPVNPKRYNELTTLFAETTANLIFISAFRTRSIMRRYLHDLAWETEVWIADNPSHLVHFNGDRFLGPYTVK